MALSFSNVIDRGSRTWRVAPGLQMSHIDMTTSTGSGGADYATGFDLQGNAAKLGLSKVFGVVGTTVREGAALDTGVNGLFDGTTGKLRFYVNATGAEVTNEVAANAVVRFFVIGC